MNTRSHTDVGNHHARLDAACGDKLVPVDKHFATFPFNVFWYFSTSGFLNESLIPGLTLLSWAGVENAAVKKPGLAQLWCIG
jgi:hypothetical protein